jgi:hypothetical protein
MPTDAVGKKGHRGDEQVRCDSKERPPPDRRRRSEDPPTAEGPEENRSERCDKEADAEDAQPRLWWLARPHKVERREGRVAEHREPRDAGGGPSERSCGAIRRVVHGGSLWPNADWVAMLSCKARATPANLRKICPRGSLEQTLSRSLGRLTTRNLAHRISLASVRKCKCVECLGRTEHPQRPPDDHHANFTAGVHKRPRQAPSGVRHAPSAIGTRAPTAHRPDARRRDSAPPAPSPAGGRV